MKIPIKNYCQLALIEKEGLGTAYEYYAKNAIIQNYIDRKEIKEILIVGLPEKYGYSMDFFILGDKLAAKITVLEDRDEKITEAKTIVSILQSKNILSENLEVNFKKVNNFIDYNYSKKYDLVLSCETLQRVVLPTDFVRYYNNKGESMIIFCPNGDNKAHNSLSGLRSIPLGQLEKQILPAVSNLKKYGYVDFLPFPPGIKRTAAQRSKANESIFVSLIMVCLTIWCFCEKFWPSFIKKRLAHIVYFIG